MISEKAQFTIFILLGLIGLALFSLGAPLAAVIVLGAILLVSVLIWKPELGLYGMCITLPMVGWEFSLAGLYFTPIDLVALAAVFALITRACWTRVFGHNPQRLRWPLLKPFLIFFAIVFISNLLNVGVLGSSWYAIRVIVFLYFGYIMFPASVIENKSQLRRALTCVALSGASVAILSLATLWGQLIDADFFRIRGIQLFGIFPFGVNHNLIAEYLVVCNFCLLSLKYWLADGPWRRCVTIIFVIFTIIALATFSRAAWIATVIQLLVYFYFRKTNRVKLMIATFAVCVLVSPLVYKMNQLQSSNSSSTASRLLLSQIAWQSVTAKPFFGFGAGNFINIVRDNIRFNAQYGDPLESHGFLQKVATEEGIIGLVAFLIVLILVFKQLFELKRFRGTHRDLFLPLAVAGLGGLVTQLFNTSYYKGKFWLPIGIALAAWNLFELKKKHASEKI